jgi:hypothetical protein
VGLSLLAAAVLAALAQTPAGGWGVAPLHSTGGGVPAHLAGMFEEPLGFQQGVSGRYLVFDRRAQAVYSYDATQGSVSRIVDIGPERGRLLGPTAFDVAGGRIVVADGPNLTERIQLFDEGGLPLGGFRLPGRASPRVTLGTLVLSGVGSLELTRRSLLINLPEAGALVTEYQLDGHPSRTFGHLRPTGHDADRDLHLALNVGLPLVNPLGGYYFVFQTGEPRFRRYEADGTLSFERLMQGPEIDGILKTMPTVWPRRPIGPEVLPHVPPVVRTAAVDPEGNLWVSFVAPYTYVFDRDGDKVRTVQFQAGGIIAPTSLSFVDRSRVLVTPGLYEFDTTPGADTPGEP